MRSYETISIDEPENGLLEVTLSRPNQLNALNMLMADELMHLASDLIGHLYYKYKAVIIRGAGRAFCSGGDLKEFLGVYDQERYMIENYISNILRLAKTWYELPIPTIACLHGAVAGGGASLALASDIRIASENTQIQFIFSRIGLIPDMGAHYLLPKLVGEATSLDLLYTGRPILSDEALQIGLVHQVVGNEELQQKTIEYARHFNSGPLDVYTQIKKLIKKNNSSIDEILNQETIIQSKRFKSPEFRVFIENFFKDKK